MIRELRKKIVSKLFGLDYLYYNYNTNEARRIGVKVGSHCRFIDTSPDTFSTEPFLIEIGNHVSMTRPKIITHDGSVWVFREMYPEIDLFGRIVIGNNCFIGEGVVILPNTFVGDNSIIGANTIIKGNYPPNSVIAGCPGKVISTIDEFFQKNENRFTYFRSLKKDKKTKILQSVLR